MKNSNFNKLIYSTLLLLGTSFSLSAQQFVNITQNAGFNVDKANWDIIYDNDSGNIASAIEPTGGYDGTGALHTGYVTEIGQTFDLTEIGYSDAILDSAPIVRFSVFAKGTGPDVGDQIRYSIELRDDNEAVIESVNSDWIITTGDWQQITHNFVNYGAGMKSIYIMIEAWDFEANLNANEGVMIDAVNLSINNHMTYTNSGATKDLAGWENIVNGGSGWNVGAYAQSSYSTCTKGQVIDLMELGYSEAALDSEPLIRIWEFILGDDGPEDGTGIGDQHLLKVELRNGSGGIIDSYDSGAITCTDDWQQVTAVLQDYGTGLRSVYVEHSGQDTEFWDGFYGGYVDATQMTLDFCQGFNVSPTVIDETMNGENDGSINLSVSGGVGSYTYAWNNGSTSASLSDLPDGDYMVTITDEYGCEQIEFYTVAAGFNVATDDIEGLDTFELTPNPTNGLVRIIVELDNQMDATLEVYDVSGRLVRNFAQENISNRIYELDLSNEPSGIYMTKLILNNEVVTKRVLKN